MESEICARINIKVEDERIAEAMFSAIKVETENIITPRSITKISQEKGRITLIFIAKDIIALRAAINSYLRMLYAVVKILKVVQNGCGRGESKSTSESTNFVSATFGPSGKTSAFEEKA